MSEQVKAIATAWMKHQGYTDAEIAAGEADLDHSLCEMVPGVGWDCMDENGYHRHPEVGALTEAAEMANVALEALAAGRAEPRVVRTVGELRGLPHGTPFQDADERLGCLLWPTTHPDVMWVGRSGLGGIETVAYPATVLTAQPAPVSEGAFVEAVKLVLLTTPYDLPTSKQLVEEVFRAAGLTVAGESDG